ncbi:hypothetical protein SAMD00019534_077540 [Acytostelium subglobosum LB1]|uniref:hypothetical protein n=1 Tax=Acytostelium subglobosum LB1 TaxID=1410327 RepID=UPI000644D18A|nr:hypothetical protein SAMD00019534_077540 [Acytostelium subglobosum LB1]GAM24579.1 hypothetical protein SAMD00019534_077540 [Acytostelium subglobosum LB1]|eukprot:XP_012752248.1 hypothetical protein SAMD00019534_077540 [Acytostelium subglobosum LB1]
MLETEHQHHQQLQQQQHHSSGIKECGDDSERIKMIKINESRQDQKRQVLDAMRSADKLVTGQSMFLISAQWMATWRNYVGLEDGHHSAGAIPAAPVNGHSATTASMATDNSFFDIPPPEPINNRSLIERDDSETLPILSVTVRERDDYEIIPEAAWQHLHRLYGGGPEIKRSVIEVGIKNERVVEVHPVIIMLQYVHRYNHNLIAPPPQSVPTPAQSTNGHHHNVNGQSNGHATLNGTESSPSQPQPQTQVQPQAQQTQPKSQHYDFIIQRSRRSPLSTLESLCCKGTCGFKQAGDVQTYDWQAS